MNATAPFMTVIQQPLSIRRMTLRMAAEPYLRHDTPLFLILYVQIAPFLKIKMGFGLTQVRLYYWF